MQVFYTPRYYAEIGEGHVFPIRKFELVRDRLLAEGTLEPFGDRRAAPGTRSKMCCWSIPRITSLVFAMAN